jgi:hypothetical protein
MSEFTFLFRGRLAQPSPEQMQQHLQTWVDWFKELRANGRLKDSGNSLELGGKLVSGKQKLVSDGPFVEAKDVIGGYILVEATDLSHATELAKGCPILSVGGSVEVRAVQTLDLFSQAKTQ